MLLLASPAPNSVRKLTLSILALPPTGTLFAGKLAGSTNGLPGTAFGARRQFSNVAFAVAIRGLSGTGACHLVFAIGCRQ